MQVTADARAILHHMQNVITEVARVTSHEAQAFEYADLVVDRLADLTVESLNGCTGAR